jgi:hypothetical protein
MLDWLHSNQRITSQQCHEEAQAILLAPTRMIEVKGVGVGSKDWVSGGVTRPQHQKREVVPKIGGGPKAKWERQLIVQTKKIGLHVKAW